LSQRITNGLIFGTDTMPQFADTRQRVLSTWLDNEEGRPQGIKRYEASIWSFDESGSISASLHESLREFMDAVSSESRIKSEGDTVVSIGPELRKRRLAAKYRWEPTTADLDAIAADIWPEGKKDRLKHAASSVRRPPRITYDAKQALEEASGQFWKIYHAIDGLKEQSLAGFIFAARDHDDPDYLPLYSALAEMAEKRLEIRRRRRRDKGTWYAFVEVLRWNSERVGESVATFHVKCQSRSAAVLATRKLLVKHADKFDDDTTVEAGIETDLEWERMPRESIADDLA
jgi:hypothetical protein